MHGPVLASQLGSPLLILLAVTALASAFLGQASDAVIIGVILAASVGMGFFNEYKAAKTAEALHSSVRHSCVTLRDRHPRTVDVTELVPGDVVDLQLGQVVPADMRLLAVAGLECDESVLTGESLPAEKSAAPVAAGTPLAELSCCALMGTVVRAGSGTGVVVATDGDAEFGRIAVGLGQQQPETEFQAGLRKFSAAGASIFLTFLPMLPSQILLNNLLYDSSQLAIPTDEVDPEQVAQPTRWDVGFIRRFMLFFGPVSSIFDFITFGVMLWVFHAGPALFRSGWFVESLATQTLVIFAIRTRRIPFFRSRPSLPLALAALTVVTIGAVLPYTGHLARILGFRPLPGSFFLFLILAVLSYLVLIEVGKHWFYRSYQAPAAPASRHRRRGYRVRRRAARFTTRTVRPARRPVEGNAPNASAV